MATLSSDALDAIKSRAEAVDSWVLAPVAGQHPDLTSLQLSAADVPALVAEVERLAAEVRRRGRLLKMSTEEIHSLHEQVEATEARADEAESILIRVVQQANTHAIDGDDGFIAAYRMPVGPVHAAIPFLQGRGIYVGESGGVYRANPIEHDGNGVVGLDRDALAEIIEWDIREDRDRSFASEQARRIADKILAALSTAGKGGK